MQLCYTMCVALLALNAVADAKIEDKITLRVFNRDFSAPDAKIRALIKQADLEGHGFQKESITQLMTRGSAKPSYQKMYFYYKTVSCDRVQEVEQELDTLLSGALGGKVLKQLGRDMKKSRLSQVKKCRAGVEIHFRGQETCGKTRPRSKRSPNPCGWCTWCGRVDAIED